MSTLTPTKLRDFPAVEHNIDPPSTLSKSKLERFDNCPRSFYLDVKYKGGPGSVEMNRGICVHEAIDRCEDRMLEEAQETGHPSSIPPEVARDIAEAVMQERTDLSLSASEMDRVRSTVWNWAGCQFATVDPETLIGIEVPLEMELNGWRLTCRLDRVEFANNSLYIYDWKSGFPGKREDTERSFQGLFYAAALLHGFNQADPNQTYGAGINDVWFYEVFPRETKGEDTKEVIAYEAVWNRTEVFEFRTSLERHLAQIEHGLETGEWDAQDGSWCGRCPAQFECPIPPHLREVEQITSQEEAELALTHKLALDREGARYQKGLREWFKENGIVYVGDYAFDAKTSESRSVDWEAVKQGTPLSEATTPKVSTKYAPRKLTKEERDASASG